MDQQPVSMQLQLEPRLHRNLPQNISKKPDESDGSQSGGGVQEDDVSIADQAKKATIVSWTKV